MTTSVHITFDDEAVPTYVKGAPSPAAAAAEGASKKNPPSESSADADAVAAKIAAADASASRREKDGKHDKKKSNADGGGRDDDAKEKEDAADDKKDAKLSPLERCEKRIRHAKRATRSELSVSGGEWQKNGYYLDASVLSTANLGDDVPRISAREVSKQEFIERFEKPRLPCIITEVRPVITLVPIRPRWRGERHSLRTFPVVSLRPGSLAFNPDTPRRLSTPLLTPLNSTPTSLRMERPSSEASRSTA